MISNREKKYKLRSSCKRHDASQNNPEKNILIAYKDEFIYDEKDCFICLELYIDNSKTIRLNNMNNYIKKCSCDGWIHEQCFNNWHNVNKYCPICRSIIVFTKYEYTILCIYNFKQKVGEVVFIVFIFINRLLLFIILLLCLHNWWISFFKKPPMFPN
uniref:RING-type domain-containing protein n=1 Tax=viral metagenome TaxID=1070528 RepID=A0A6C0IEY0_9ZZZZ